MEVSRRLVFPREGEVAVEEVRVDPPGPNEARVRNRASLVSAGTELSLYTGVHTGLKDPKNSWAKFPFRPGYAAVGEVEEVGVSVSEIKPGDRVFHGGRHEDFSRVGLPVYPVPPGMKDEEALFLELGFTALNGVRQAEIALGESVLVVGLGVVGQLAAQWARAAGALEVVVADVSARRIEIARALGADRAIRTDQEELPALAREWTQGRGFDAVIEATGVPKVIPLCFKAAAPLGRVVLLGSPRGTVETDFYTEVHVRGLRVIGAHIATSADVENKFNRWTNRNQKRATLAYLSRGALKTAPLVSHRLPPERAKEAYDGLRDRKEEYIGVVFQWV